MTLAALFLVSAAVCSAAGCCMISWFLTEHVSYLNKSRNGWGGGNTSWQGCCSLCVSDIQSFEFHLHAWCLCCQLRSWCFIYYLQATHREGSLLSLDVHVFLISLVGFNTQRSKHEGFYLCSYQKCFVLHVWHCTSRCNYWKINADSIMIIKFWLIWLKL